MPITRGVDAKIARSWLLVNAGRPETFEPAAASRADQIILDIEDAVDPAYKAEARRTVIDWLATSGHSAWVRINDHTTTFWESDVRELSQAAAAGGGLAGVMLAKAEAPEHVTETFDRLGGSLPVIALVESALGIEESVRIARARGAFRLAFGSGDYRRDTGTAADDLAMAYPRSRLVVASRIGNLPGPIDGPTVGSSHAVLREQSALTVALGLTGKLCLQAEQVPVINEVISPTQSDIVWAQDFLADFEARGRVVRDGSDLPRLGRARKIMNLAAALGLIPSS
ncbi:citrate lyase subunit beta / citryl-CoA lyase [Quadrisphaera granulorum]|uniref:Citrate lyase subunit beta/citryl-CoA lyase n=1 Tax=Quadrisphaera granulorum TaxID=317664 RepID=A0A315ZQG0_9ACTN|nr:aldolase/citrate lyase family protein [Quadrisphaera granulorum]PWJ47220.1 citrate lyase subunit beta/citryl-CoA lyase [Quadrisphaera granulorum]SZE98906.1 citrate lyase subunit beta / citryl-CoA lyase [Quadrisphaera granulorum]